ncbi:unnamed protein product [Clonostachys rhizophaga]|uniref:Protein NO VEIN C-terminal domain-containing protein n=1 Tax=Clonostachys rhizophaga TaxID=160324 RepID=A0A9N9VN54_9HYPO|nr:unnamed protein product [Clonostachys rhizophaga]
MASRKEAREMVERNTSRYGYLSDDILSQLDTESRRKLERNWAILESVAGHSVQTLAKHIYGSGARFVFELLQNADDNSFERATRNGDTPYISFQVHPDRIIVECNEDGFNEKDLGAICSVGQSSKAGSHGYIGAKGIGFKSVFIAAWKVYIQSRHFSFYFRHEKGDSGLGMIRPIWKEPEEDGPLPFTRMTLHIHEKWEPGELQHLKSIIFKQFEELQKTCLLFLKKIKNISVSFYNDDGSLKDSKSFKAADAGENRVSLETVSETKGQHIRELRYYHITKHTATNIARSDNRDPPTTDEARRLSATAEIVLAFPLTEKSEPLLEKQDLFAFLPVRELEYKFIIQSDFDTSANRQDIVTSSRRNMSLQDGIASAFVKAVLQFLHDPTLCYQWPRFLPATGDSSNSFWSSLNEKIEFRILNTPIMRSRHRMQPRFITEVYQQSSDSSDENGNCLYDDTSTDPYISKMYERNDISILHNYGLRLETMAMILNLVKYDLDSSNSRMKDFSRSQSWHSRAAIPLAKWAIHPDFKTGAASIRTLPLIPLKNGNWTSLSSGQVYLPITHSIPIPLDLGYRLVDPRALVNPDREKLFKHIGVVEAEVSQIQNSIEVRYNTSGQTITLEQSISHLHYLYLTHHDGNKRSKVDNLLIYTEDRRLIDPRRFYVYIANDHPYGPKRLLEPTKTAPGHPVTYLHSSYFENPPANGSSLLSWEDWLYTFVGIQRRLPVTNGVDKLSDPFEYIAKHRPDRFIDTLEFLWKNQSTAVRENKNIKELIQGLWNGDHCEAGAPSHRTLIPDQPWLPDPHLKNIVAKYTHGSSVSFPFLRIDGFETKDVEGKWAFLHRDFNVVKDDNIGFYLEILFLLSRSEKGTEMVCGIFEIYQTLEAKITIADNRATALAEVRSCMFEDCLILSPKYQTASGKFVDEEFVGDGDDIRWEGPPDLESVSCVAQRYRQFLDAGQMQKLTMFFRDTLGIQDVSWKDIVEELGWERKKLENLGEQVDFDRVKGLYQFMARSNAPKAEMKRTFIGSRLIYVARHGVAGWYSSSDCLWSSTSEIRGKVTLNDDYDSLETFFTGTLGVQSLTLQMMYDELRHAGGQKSIDDIKNDIWSLNALLQTDRTHIDPVPLLREAIFPVKYPEGGLALRNIDAVFAVGDDRQLCGRLQSHINLLDYDFEDIRRLKPFICWVKLDERYLSQSVREFTRVSSSATRRPITEDKYDISRKAYAILRLAKTFQSPKYDKDDPESLYKVLRDAEVIESDGISSVISISQDGKSIELEETAGLCHIDDSQKKLKIAVPLNKKQRNLSFSSVLPNKLADWLMREWDSNISDKEDKDGIHILRTILSCDLAIVDDILNHNSVFEVGIENRDPQYDEESDGDDSALDEEYSDASSIQFTPSRSFRTDTTDLYGATPIREGALSPRANLRGSSEPRTTSDGDNHLIVERIQAVSREESRNARASVWNQDQPTPQGTSQAQDAGYLRLLHRVIAASRNAVFPSLGAFDMTGLINELPNVGSLYESFDGLDVATRFRSTSQLERDKMVGAAGELYVFELLSALQLPGWSRGNWQSTIRKYVTGHPDYHDMRPWYQRETADIVYPDVQGEFTTLLIDNGYLGEEWRAARPKYLLEVKTSTGPLATPFYMSKNQYQLMKNIHNIEDRSEVYMILRVFWLDSNNIGMRVYLDPEQMRQEGGLIFTGETWSITPGIREGN